MLKHFFKLTFFAALFSVMLTACGGVNQSDPQSVAEAVMKCYVANDYNGIIEYVNPQNTFYIKNLNKMQEIADQAKAEGREEKAKPQEVSFKTISDGLTSKEKNAEFKYVTAEGEEWTRAVILEQADGKWYVAGIR